MLAILQFIFSIVVIGLYGSDIGRANKPSSYAPEKWNFAVVVGCMSALSSWLHPTFLGAPWLCFWVWFLLYVHFLICYSRRLLIVFSVD